MSSVASDTAPTQSTPVPADSLSFAGDVSIDYVTLITSKGMVQDVTPQVIGIEIYEDIFSPFLSGKLMLKDAQDIITAMPLIGEEFVALRVRTPLLPDDYAYEYTFQIYKLDDRERISERQTMYVLHFMSVEGLVDANKKISKTYSGKVSDIVKKIIVEGDALESDKDANIEDTPNSTKFTANFWSPVQCINYLTQNAINQNKSPSYVFFENKFGLNFISLESLYTNTPVYQTFTWDNYSAEVASGGGSSKNIAKDYQRIIEIRTPQTFNYIDRIQSGLYGSQMVTYDLTTKTYAHSGYTPNFDEDKHLNKYPMWTNKVIAKQRAMLIREHRYYNNFSGFGDVTNTKTIQRRVSLMAQAEAFKIELVVLGRTDYSVGQKVKVIVPKSTQLKATDLVDDFNDKIHSGDYLVSAICHLVTRQGHECIMELIKESFIVDLNNA